MKEKNINLKNKRILLTGGNGFVGQKVYEELINRGADKKNIFITTSKQHDLRELKNVRKVVADKHIVIHLAARVGGIGYNREYPGTLLYDNALMGIHLIEESRKAGVEKFVQIGTVCAYPKVPKHIPFLETDLWSGYPEETNAPYGLSKLILLEMLRAYRKQYNFNGIYLLPTNIYGPGDNFDPESSHVIPALIKKFIEAKENKKSEVVVWGTGTASREFIYVCDVAKAIVDATIKYNGVEPVNIGSQNEIKIKKLVTLIAKLTGFKGKIVWDSTKPDGQPRRKLDVARAQKEFGFVAQTDFETGLQEAIKWYLQNR